MQKTTLAFLLTIAGSIVALVYLAQGGDVWAVSILVAVWTLLNVSFGAFIVIYVNRQQGIRQQADFAENAKENLAMMQQLQRIQNEQNKGLMHQLGQTARLPAPQANGSGPAWIIEPGIFDELE